MNVATIRDSIQSRLASTVTGIKWYDTWPNRLSPPAGMTERLAGPERMGLGSGGPYLAQMQVVVLVHPASDVKRAKDQLDAFLATSGGSSIVAALEGDDTLSGTVQKVLVGPPQHDEAIPANGQEYVGLRFDLEVYAS